MSRPRRTGPDRDERLISGALGRGKHFSQHVSPPQPRTPQPPRSPLQPVQPGGAATPDPASATPGTVKP